MPAGVPGSLTHGLSAAKNGKCHCSICRAAVAV